MPPRQSHPSLRRHKPSYQGVVTLSGHDHYLGHWPESTKKAPPAVVAAYDALIAEWLANGRSATRKAEPVTVAELILHFWDRHATTHYRHADGTPTSELDNYKLSLRPLRRLFGPLPVADFSPLKLKAVRQALVDEGISRGVINQRVGRVKRVVKWGVAEELVPETVYRALLAVDGLRAGRTGAAETTPVLPVPDAHVDAVLPLLRGPVRAMVRAMVRVQRLTGMRPGEAARMRGADLDTTGEVWLYRPARHKTAWRGRERLIPIGPRCQDVLRAFLKPDADAYLFSPKDGREEWFAAGRRTRKSAVPPSQTCRRKAAPRRTPGSFYTRHAYAAAIGRACRKAGVPHWHPNQLRHTGDRSPGGVRPGGGPGRPGARAGERDRGVRRTELRPGDPSGRKNRVTPLSSYRPQLYRSSACCGSGMERRETN